MRVDPSLSEYHESVAARDSLDTTELWHCRALLRRLRFLEAQLRERPDAAGDSAMFAAREMEALAWMLNDVEFLATDETRRVPVAATT